MTHYLKNKPFEAAFALSKYPTLKKQVAFGKIMNMPGLKIKADMSTYYLSRKNEQKNGKPKTVLNYNTSNALSLLVNIVLNNATENIALANEDGSVFYSELYIPAELKKEKIFSQEIYGYKTKIDLNTNRIETKIILDDRTDFKLSEDEQQNIAHTQIPVLAAFALMLMHSDTEYNTWFDQFIQLQRYGRQLLAESGTGSQEISQLQKKSTEDFVMLNEELYQRSKDIEKDENNPLDIDIVSSIEGITEGTDILKNKFKEEVRQEQAAKKVKEMFNPKDFTEEQLDKIPELPDHYVLQDKLKTMCNKIKDGIVNALILYGPTGTGKSIACKLMCQKLGLPLMAIYNGTLSTDDGAMFGKYVPNSSGGFDFKPTDLTMAIEKGGAVLIDEINSIKGENLMILYGVLDDNKALRLRNGQIIKVHPNFRMFATMNPNYVGTQPISPALWNKFQAKVEIGELDDEIIRRKLISEIPGCKKKIDKILNVYKDIRNYFNNIEDCEQTISVRDVLNWVQQAENYDGYLAAAEDTLVSCAMFDKDLEKAIRDTVRRYRFE